MTIPMSIYETRTMLRVLEQLTPPRTFLLDTFFKESDFALTEHVDIDIVQGKRKMAPFVSPLHEGKVMTREGYTTQTFKPAYIKPKRVSSVADLMKRLPGESIYSPLNLTQRAASLMTKDLVEMDEYITRREEWMAMKQLTTGKIPVKGEGVDVEIDLLVDGSHLLTGTDLGQQWDQSDAKPLDDLDDLELVISQDSGLGGVVIIMGTTTLKLFRANTQVRSEWLPAGGQNVGISMLPGNNVLGAIYQGTVRGKQIWTYNELYIDDDGSTKTMIPAKSLLVASPQARAVRHYGLILDLAAPGGAAVRRFPKSWEEQDPSVRLVMVQSAPLPVFHQVGGFIFVDDVTA